MNFTFDGNISVSYTHLFRWRGMDGTEVTAHFVTTTDPGEDYYTYNGKMCIRDSCNHAAENPGAEHRCTESGNCSTGRRWKYILPDGCKIFLQNPVFHGFMEKYRMGFHHVSGSNQFRRPDPVSYTHLIRSSLKEVSGIRSDTPQVMS